MKIGTGTSCGYRFNLDKKNIIAEIGEVDICFIDLDECIYPFITKASLNFLVYRSLFIKNRHLLTGKEKWQILKWFPMIAGKKVLRDLNLKVSEAKLILDFENLLMGIPREIIESEAKKIAPRCYPGFYETVEYLSKFFDVGIISQGLEPVLSAITDYFNNQIVGASSTSPVLSFSSSTVMEFSYKGRFTGYKMSETLLYPSDKRTKAEEWLKKLGKEKPLVIGHNRGDEAMVEMAKDYKGLSLGFNPSRSMRAKFDVCIYGRNWYPIYQFFSDIIPLSMD